MMPRLHWITWVSFEVDVLSSYRYIRNALWNASYPLASSALVDEEKGGSINHDYQNLAFTT